MEKPSRPVRNRKQSRRMWSAGDIAHRQVKRLFTPDIKKMLKEWLIRRRDNPYPSRDEKKTLAHDTGLTYTQICNWFANWRRKLKNSGKEPVRRSWGNLIKNYNTSARGNVEQFSISSGDSIWGEEENNANNYIDNDDSSSTNSFDSYEPDMNGTDCNGFQNNDNQVYDVNNNYLKQYNREPYYPPGYYFMNPEYQLLKGNQQNLQIDQQTFIETVNQRKNFEDSMENKTNQLFKEHTHQDCIVTNTKYKQQMMEKYLKDTNSYNDQSFGANSSTNICSSSPELSKWLESTAKFTPNKNNYIEWNCNQRTKADKKLQKCADHFYGAGMNFCDSLHQKEELEAAEALTNLACNYRLKMLNTTENRLCNTQ